MASSKQNKFCPKIVNHGALKNLLHSESGRSMVEILGVLAVVGVLSLVGLYGFRYAYETYRENKTVDTITKSMAGAVTGFSESAVEESTQLNAEQFISNIELKDEQTVATPLETDITVWIPESKTVAVHLDNITYGACTKILKTNGTYMSAHKTNKITDGIYHDASDEDKEAFCLRVDEMKRQPLHMVEPINPAANMILCYSQNGEACRLEEPICIGNNSIKPLPSECVKCENGELVNEENGSNKQEDGKCCVDGVMMHHERYCPEPPCPTSELEPEDSCAEAETHSATDRCPAYTTYTEIPCECSDGYKRSCPNGQYALTTQTLKDGTACYECADCPTDEVEPEGVCSNRVDFPSEQGCEAYTRYISIDCKCSEGYQQYCAEGEYAVDTETLKDGTSCYKCEFCPTDEPKPTNICFKEITHPAQNGCPAYKTYNGNTCSCADFGLQDGIHYAHVYGDKCNRYHYNRIIYAADYANTDGFEVGSQTNDKTCAHPITGTLIYTSNQAFSNVTLGVPTYLNVIGTAFLDGKNMFIPQDYSFIAGKKYPLNIMTANRTRGVYKVDLFKIGNPLWCH